MSKIIIKQTFLNERFKKTILKKEYNCDIIPSTELEIEDAAWEKPKKIKKVILTPSDNQYVVFVDEEFITKKTAKTIIEKFTSLGWEII